MCRRRYGHFNFWFVPKTRPENIKEKQLSVIQFLKLFLIDFNEKQLDETVSDLKKNYPDVEIKSKAMDLRQSLKKSYRTFRKVVATNRNVVTAKRGHKFSDFSRK